MYIHGEVASTSGNIIKVEILTRGDRSIVREIGVEEDGILWQDDPVEINNEMNDTFDHLLRHSATIHISCSSFISDFYNTTCRDAVVNIRRNGRMVFAGFIEPLAFSQGFCEVWDDVDLHCIDAISALQYSNYLNIGQGGDTYDTAIGKAGMRSMFDVLNDTIGKTAATLDISGDGYSLLYDGSKYNDKGNRWNVFSEIMVSELLFLGDSEDDIWTEDSVVEEIMRYLDLHIMQEGTTFRIYAWETAKGNDGIEWRDIRSPRETKESTTRNITDITLDIVDDDKTEIEIDESFNKLVLKCDTKTMDSIIESPLDESSLSSPFSGKQLYLTEYSSDGEGMKAFAAFYEMIHEGTTDYDAASITDWYVWVMKHPQWTFRPQVVSTTDGGVFSPYSGENKRQNALPDHLGMYPGSAIIKMGKIVTKAKTNDNSPTSKVDMSSCMVISIHGNLNDNKDITYPNEDVIKSWIPCAVYTGNKAGGVFSSADESVTNYIVISGNIVLAPVMKVTGEYKLLHDKEEWNNEFSAWWHKTVPSRTNKDGRYYTRKYWKTERPNDEPQWNESYASGLVPFTNEGPQNYKFNYCTIKDSSDKISKVAILACMLVIGDKCVVEKQIGETFFPEDVPGTGEGKITDYAWRPYKKRVECANDDEYYSQSFTIGFNPKIGDYIIGQEYDIQNNISYRMNIDAEGTAIPIKSSDKLSGAVKFEILGPVNEVWNDVTRRHKTWFKREKWKEKDVSLLAHIDNIILKEFEVKLYSDSGGYESNNDDNDIIYMSDTAEGFSNVKDDLEFKLTSDLTSEERQLLGVSSGIYLSTPLLASSGNGLLKIRDYNTGEEAKPEQLYINAHYDDCHVPRVTLKQNIKDEECDVSLFDHYRHPAMNKEFWITGFGYNLKYDTVNLALREI